MKFNKLVGAMAAFAVMAAVVPAAANAGTIRADVSKVQAVKAEASDQILVKVKAGKDSKALASKHGASLKKSLHDGWKVMKVPAGDTEKFLAKFKADADVESAEVDAIMSIAVTPNDPSYGSQYHLPKIQAPQAWDVTTGSTARTIAIVDTGVDLAHQDLAGKFTAGYDFVNNDTVAQDDQGHGTHCAGIAAAIGNNGKDVAGVDFNAKIMPVKVLNKRGSGYTSDIIDGVNWAAANGAHVISMSLGGGSATAAFQSAIDAAWAKGIIIVAAAGNSSTSTKSYPAAYNNVVAVASTDSADVMSYFSNYGSWVDIAAPGSSILSLRNGGGTTTMSGTSMATPVVAGLASLTWSKKLTATNSAVVNQIYSTADAIAGTGSQFQNGRVNAYRAVSTF